jgi:hypothetical protein
VLYKEVIDVCTDTKHINTFCGHYVKLLNVNPGGTRSNNWALKGQELFWPSTVQGTSGKVIKKNLFQSEITLFRLYVSRKEQGQCIPYSG